MKRWCIRAREVGEGGAGMAVTGGHEEGLNALLSDMLEINKEIFGSSEKVIALCKHFSTDS